MAFSVRASLKTGVGGTKLRRLQCIEGEQLLVDRTIHRWLRSELPLFNCCLRFLLKDVQAARPSFSMTVDMGGLEFSTRTGEGDCRQVLFTRMMQESYER